MLKGVSVKCMECLNKYVWKKEEKYNTFFTCMGKDDKIANSAKLLDITTN